MEVELQHVARNVTKKLKVLKVSKDLRAWIKKGAPCC
jgi:hypothetical protein